MAQGPVSTFPGIDIEDLPPRRPARVPGDPSDLAESMERLYREHGAIQALTEDDPSLLPAGMTMDEARKLVG